MPCRCSSATSQSAWPLSRHHPKHVQTCFYVRGLTLEDAAKRPKCMTTSRVSRAIQEFEMISQAR